MEILIGKKQAHPFVFVKARRCGSIQTLVRKYNRKRELH